MGLRVQFVIVKKGKKEGWFLLVRRGKEKKIRGEKAK